jgi:hypothetical protein
MILYVNGVLRQEVDMDINNLKNKHKGTECYILGTGPSLNKEIVDNLHDKLVISMSGIVFAKKLWNFEPDYLVSVDYKNFSDKNTWNLIKNTNANVVLSKWIILKANQFGYQYTHEQFEWIKKQYLVNYTNSIVWKPRLSSIDAISFDLNNGSFVCGTGILDLAIPLSVWMGCNKLNLIGCDCTPTGHFYDHKTDEYDMGPKDPTVINQYNLMYEKLNKIGIKIYNINKELTSCPGIPKRNIQW